MNCEIRGNLVYFPDPISLDFLRVFVESTIRRKLFDDAIFA